MRLMAATAAALLLAGCGGPEKRSVHATLDADHESGSVTMMCTASSSGTCHGLFVTGSDVARIAAAAGTSAGTTGITSMTRYCLDVAEPGQGCSLRPLAQGEQIVRQEKAPRR
ncbi:MAG: hypothetical protein V4574_09820 [Pseudomonadota bacterium]